MTEQIKVRVSGPGGLVSAVPSLLGFEPTESLVAIGMKNNRLDMAMRMDLEPQMALTAVAVMVGGEIHRRMDRAGAEQIALVLYTETDRGQWAELVRVIEASTDLMDAMCVQDGKFWSYLCDNPECCPPAGTPVPYNEELAAANALTGKRIVEDRDAVLASLAGPEIDTVTGYVSTAAPLDPRCVLGVPDVEYIRYLSDQECAGIAVALCDVQCRDSVLAAAATDEDALPALLEALRVVLRPLGTSVAPVATTYAAMAYMTGDGLRTRTALDRALAEDPDYSLARLLSRALDAQVPPSAIREVVQILDEG